MVGVIIILKPAGFIAGWRHALRSEWPFIISSISITKQVKSMRKISEWLDCEVKFMPLSLPNVITANSSP